MTGAAPTPAGGPPGARARRAEAVRQALAAAPSWDPARVAEYAGRSGVAVEEVRAHLAGRFAAFEVAIERLLALATHTTPDRQVVLRDALDALRPPYERALAEARGLRSDEGGAA